MVLDDPTTHLFFFEFHPPLLSCVHGFSRRHPGYPAVDLLASPEGGCSLWVTKYLKFGSIVSVSCCYNSVTKILPVPPHARRFF